jgi:hypothetical protein
LIAAAKKLQNHLAPVRSGAMLGDVNALPGAERHFALSHRHMQRDPVEHGFDMRRHIVLFSEGGDRRHAAMIRFAAQPAQEDALQQLGVESVCLGPSVLAVNRDTIWVG